MDSPSLRFQLNHQARWCAVRTSLHQVFESHASWCLELQPFCHHALLRMQTYGNSWVFGLSHVHRARTHWTDLLQEGDEKYGKYVIMMNIPENSMRDFNHFWPIEHASLIFMFSYFTTSRMIRSNTQFHQSKQEWGFYQFNTSKTSVSSHRKMPGRLWVSGDCQEALGKTNATQFFPFLLGHLPGSQPFGERCSKKNLQNDDFWDVWTEGPATY